MTTQTIALLGGVVVLLLLLVAARRRRAKAEAAPAPSRMSDVADVVVPTPAAIPGPTRLSAAEGMPETAPVQAPPAPAAAEPLVVPQSWTSEEVVREPGWLMPGEVENVWQADFAANAAVPAGAGVPAGSVNGVGHANGNGHGHAASAADMGSLVDGAMPGFDPAAGWSGATTVEMDRSEPDDEPSIPQWDPVEDPPAGDGGEPPADVAMAAWSEDALVGWAEPALEADVEAWAAQVEPVVLEPVIPEAVVPDPVVDLVEAFVPEIALPAIEPVDQAPAVVAEPVVAEPVAVEELTAWPVTEWAVQAPVEVPAEPLAEGAVPDAPAVAWWDEIVETEPDVEPVALGDTEAGTGRFALGGFALQAGHEAIAGVTFRGALPAAPTAWTVAPADEVAPGTLVLSVDGAVNTGADEVAVLMDEGFAPSPEGFTVRAAARAAGPFAVSGTFRVS